MLLLLGAGEPLDIGAGRRTELTPLGVGAVRADDWMEQPRGSSLQLEGTLAAVLMELKPNVEADLLTVVLPEYMPDHWWEHILHGQSAQFLKLALLFTPGFVVTSMPIYEYVLVREQAV
jgi:hypothetical protein